MSNVIALNTSDVVKDLRFEDKDKDKNLWSLRGHGQGLEVGA